MEIKFISEGADKIFTHGMYQFLVIRQGRDGYTLSIDEWFHVPHPHILNKYCSRSVPEGIPYESPCSIARIRDRITDFLNKN